jgi:RNA polymerase sigma-70 factor (ECF subfamily)
LRGWLAFKEQKVNEKIENPPAFLFQIARNLVTDYYREKNKFEVISTEYYPRIIDPKMDLEDKIAKDSELIQIKKALMNLNNEDYKEAILLHYIEDLPISEVAKIMKKSEGAVRVTLHRALKALREAIPKEI